MTNATLPAAPPLTNDFKAEYLRYKFQMRNGFEQAIKAVEAIRDKRLYRVEYDTFEAFCQKELAHTRQHINRLIKAVNIILELEPSGFQPANERQARVLAELTGEQQRDVLAIAKVTAPEGKVTASWIESTAIVMKTAGRTGGFVDTGNGEMTAIGAAINQEDYERHKRQEEHIKAGRTKPDAVIECAAGNVAVELMKAGIDAAEMVRVVVYRTVQP